MIEVRYDGRVEDISLFELIFEDEVDEDSIDDDEDSIDDDEDEDDLDEAWEEEVEFESEDKRCRLLTGNNGSHGGIGLDASNSIEREDDEDEDDEDDDRDFLEEDETRCTGKGSVFTLSTAGASVTANNLRDRTGTRR